MRVRLSTNIDLPPETVWSKVQTASLLLHIAWPMVLFEPVGYDPLETFRSGARYQVKLRLFGLVPFGTQWIVTSVHEPEMGDWPKRLRDNGYSRIINKWDHWITIAPDASGGTYYSDDIEISAGILTPFVWAFAQLYYRHRQRRWRGLERIKAIVQRQQRVPPERYDNRFLIERQHRGFCILRPGWKIGNRGSLLPLCHGLLVDAMTLGQNP